MAILFTVLIGCCGILISYYFYTTGSRNIEAIMDNKVNELFIRLLQQQDKRQFLQQSAHGDEIIYLYTIDGNQYSNVLEHNIAGKYRYSINNHDYIIKTVMLGLDSKVSIGLKISEDVMQRQFYFKLLFFVVILFMLFVIIISFLISTFVVRRTNMITATAHQIIKTEDLSQRISINTKWDDLGYLALVINSLLDKLEDLVVAVKEVSSNIAHDLRTPLTRLRNNMELMRYGKADANLDTNLNQLVKEIDHILEIFNSLLRITNVEKGKRDFMQVNLTALLIDVVDFYEPLAEESKGIKIKLAIANDNASISGDKHLLFQAIANLLDNAIKFSPENSCIEVSLMQDNTLNIADQGIGVARADKDKIFNRFYRGEKSRNTTGSGLGLSLVKAVAELHNANIKLTDNYPGLRVQIFFK
jgi:signal transduction histidine kinase